MQVYAVLNSYTSFNSTEAIANGTNLTMPSSVVFTNYINIGIVNYDLDDD